MTSIVFVFVLVLDTADHAAKRNISSAPHPLPRQTVRRLNYGYHERYETTTPLAGGFFKNDAFLKK